MPSWALIVGINEYDDQVSLNDLGGAVADACDFAEWALDPQGADILPQHLHFWTYPWPEDPGPNLADFLSRDVNDWRRIGPGSAKPDQSRGPYAVEIVKTGQMAGREAYFAATNAGDDEPRRVYVFLAGHGLRAGEFTDPSAQTCFVAYDFEPVSSSVVAGLVPTESFRKALLTNRFTEAIMFLDCCRNENRELAASAQGIVDLTEDPALTWAMANAAQEGEIAYETDLAPARGAFSKTLMEALRTHRGPNGELHVDELRQYVLRRIRENTSQHQKPSLRASDDPPGPLIVAGQPGLPPAAALPLYPGPLVDVSALAAGTQLVLRYRQNELVPTAPLVVGGASLQLPDLPDGIYSIEVLGSPQRYDTFRVPGEANARVS